MCHLWSVPGQIRFSQDLKQVRNNVALEFAISHTFETKACDCDWHLYPVLASDWSVSSILASDWSVSSDMADNLPGDVIHECQDAFTSVAGGVEGIIHANQVRGSGLQLANCGLC